MLRNILSFLAVAKNGQISETARQSGMKQSNLSNYLKELNAYFGTELFYRVHKGVQLTETGKQVFEIACGIEHTLYEIQNFSNSAHQVSGDLRLWASEGIGAMYISECLPEFYRQYPDVHLEISCSLDAPQNIHEIDMAIVYQEPKQENAVIIHKGFLSFALYASKEYLSQSGYPKDLKDMIENHRICSRGNYCKWHSWNEVITNAKHLVTTTNSSGMLLSIVKEGVGISLLPICVAQKEDELMRLSKIPMVIDHPFWIISHKDTKDLPKVRALLDFIKGATGQL